MEAMKLRTEDTKRAPESGAARKKVLVVEDDPSVLFIAKKRLRSAGYEVVEARDGVEALRMMVEHPDCRFMVTDFRMPELGGDTWIKFLERFCGDWTIAVASGEDVDPGPFIYVPKPVDYDNLVTIFGQNDA